MGNRAVITTEKRDLGVYLHWNGGRDSVEAILEYCRLREFRPPESDSYGWARLCQVAANFFGPDGLSVGISVYSDDELMNPGDNGIYVTSDWRIVGRVGLPGSFVEQCSHERLDLLVSIDGAQPERERVGRGFLTSEEVETKRLRVGDRVFVRDLTGAYREASVVAWEPWPGNSGRCAVPIVNLYCKPQGGVDYGFPLNYLLEDRYRIARMGASVG